MIKRAKKWTRVPEVPLHEFVLFGIGQYLDRVALVDAVDPSLSYTYEVLHKRIKAVSSSLVKYGFGKGDVLAFFAPNSTQYVIGTMATFSIGATFTGVNFSYKAYELAHQLSDCQAKGIFTISENIPTIKKVLGDKSHKTNLKKIITLDKRVPGCEFIGDMLKDDGSAYPYGLTFNVHEDLGAIMYSSGTTGLPKGVMLTHYNLVSNLSQLMDPNFIMGLGSGTQVVLAFLPMFHMFGMLVLLATLSVGSKMVTIAGFNPETFLQCVQDHKVTNLYVVPPVVVFLAKSPMVAKYDVSCVKQVVSGAAPLTGDVERDFLGKFGIDTIYQGYGMTESTASVTVVPIGKSKLGSSGVLIANTEAKVVHVTTGKVLSTKQEGEIWVKGPQLMKGYYNKPEATRNTIDTEGWLHTGDVGYFDEDDYFFITGRIKELIKHKGFQVAPAELEGVLMTHPGVSDAAVIGIPEPSAGELPRAFVVRKPNATITEKDIFDFIKERLTRHKWLTGGVQFVAAIPKTASGKIIRREVQKMMTNSKL